MIRNRDKNISQYEWEMRVFMGPYFCWERPGPGLKWSGRRVCNDSPKPLKDNHYVNAQFSERGPIRINQWAERRQAVIDNGIKENSHKEMLEGRY